MKIQFTEINTIKITVQECTL